LGSSFWSLRVWRSGFLLGCATIVQPKSARAPIHWKGFKMQILGRVTLMTTAIDLTASCAGMRIDDAAGLRSMHDPMIDVATDVQRINDTALNTSFGALGATWEAASGL
jgi:hypothetical protein